jgi:hypothetical protein
MRGRYFRLRANLMKVDRASRAGFGARGCAFASLNVRTPSLSPAAADTRGADAVEMPIPLHSIARRNRFVGDDDDGGLRFDRATR